ncbi:ATP-dependent helicase HrpB [Kocuria subflava]|uniref:ATP-dependent helicase HrpB n=1 Tax=Kocuria subflava TaxID=1736139 RepID=A0A846U613_9MICC|nr:ATP-dependent helicase HrpB [Kocuria subflava]
MIDDLSRHGINHLVVQQIGRVSHGRLLSDQAGPSHTVLLTVPLNDRGVTRDFLDHVAQTCARALDGASNALVFVPGAREVAQVAARLREMTTGVDIVELHGRIGPREQDRAVSGRGARERTRVVVATSLAESSLTVPGVRLVIDSGLSREPRRDTVRGMSGLVTVAASRASADQRAGRAARLGPGRVIRCYDQRTWAAMPAHSTPEIATADLTSATLMLAVWGTPRGEGLALPEPPPTNAATEAETVLHRLGALDDAGRATDLGRRLCAVPTDPRLARGLMEGASLVGVVTAAQVVALLGADAAPAGGDLAQHLQDMRSRSAADAERQGQRQRHGHSHAAWQREANLLERMAHKLTATADGASQVDPDRVGGKPTSPVPSHLHAGAVIALARPEWVAHRQGDSYLFAGGTRAGLPPGSSLNGHEWLAVADVTRAQESGAQGTGAVIRAAAPLDQDTAQMVAASLLTNTVAAEFTDGRVTARRRHALGAITLNSTPVKPTHEQAEAAVRSGLTRDGLDTLHWSETATQLRARMAAVHAHLGPPWPAVDDDALLNTLDLWLGAEMDELARGTRVKDLDLTSALRRLLPWPDAARFDELAPTALTVPSGSAPRIRWDADQPVVRVKLQECFGLAESPRVLNGAVPVVFHLLSPAGRELAITADLASFWSGPYAQVRAEMRGRYPKHPWPENPWVAQATARTKTHAQRTSAGEHPPQRRTRPQKS